MRFRSSITDRAAAVISHLETLNEEALQDESARFFKWMVMYRLSSCNRVYASALLKHFHLRGLLLGKSTADNPLRQMKKRYLVVFSMGNHVFAKTYNSIRELKTDTGKRPSQIRRMTTQGLTCDHLS